MTDRTKAIEIWRKYNSDESLYKHALCVEAAMKYFSDKYKGDKDKWALAGLLHDIDYGMFPKEHCKKCRELLSNEGVEEEIIRAVESHGYGLCSDVEPISDMEKVLFAVDELTGFVTACALVRPSKSLNDLELKSVKKKWKDKAFAAGCDRSVIEKGCEKLGVCLDDLITETILSLRPIGKDIGLN